MRTMEEEPEMGPRGLGELDKEDDLGGEDDRDVRDLGCMDFEDQPNYSDEESEENDTAEELLMI